LYFEIELSTFLLNLYRFSVHVDAFIVTLSKQFRLIDVQIIVGFGLQGLQKRPLAQECFLQEIEKGEKENTKPFPLPFSGLMQEV
jgi:hypothetical protein